MFIFFLDVFLVAYFIPESFADSKLFSFVAIVVGHREINYRLF